MIARRLLPHRDFIAGVLAQVLQYGAALLLLPLIATQLDTAEIGVWYVFVTIQGLSALIDFGFQPNIARAFAAAFAGSPELLREGLSSAASSEPNLPLVQRILISARKLYLAIAVVTLLLLLSGGLFYVTSITQGEAVRLHTTQFAWCVFAFGVALNLYLLWAPPLLMGSGRIYQSYLFTIATRGGFAVLGTIVLLFGGGLIGLAAAQLVSVLLGGIVLLVTTRPVIRQLSTVTAASTPVLRALWHNASRTGLMMAGGFLINRANVFIFSSFIGLAVSSRYAFTLQVFSAAMAIAQLPTTIALPRMTALRVRGELFGLTRLFLSRHLFLLASFTIIVLVAFVAGIPLLGLIGSHIAFLPTPEYLLFAVILLLELNSVNCAYLLSTNNKVPFTSSALISGIAVTLLSLAAVWLGYGVMGALVAQGLVQLAYNNWKWPLETWKELREWRSLAKQ
jgi:hypothetical protein